MQPSWTMGPAILLAVFAGVPTAAQVAATRVHTSNGVLEGVLNRATGVRSFKGVPFAAPPVGDLRWREPRPVINWSGVRPATNFGPRAMQLPVFGDMVFRSNGMSEDCLYLNIWTTSRSTRQRLPVLVYFYGGGFVGGDGSESRYDGESMATKGIVTVTVNYRLGIFGFMAHPDATKESPHHASGNYGLLDQCAALRWVHRNIAAFGGDPKRVTIGGESAGSFSVSVLMASPLSKGLIAGAIGESGSILGQTLAAHTLTEAEKNGALFGDAVGAHTLEALRAVTAEKLLDATKINPFRFSITVDGYLLPKPASAIYLAGEQAHVPLLAGWNAEETSGTGFFGGKPPTPARFAAAVRSMYGDRTDDALKVYGASNSDEALRSATALASDRFIVYGTWKWTDIHAKTGTKPVYRYLYAHPRPGQSGAAHANEIEYALGNLSGNKVYAWTEDDRKVSAVMQQYFANFIKSANPNGHGLPEWPIANSGPQVQIMRIDVTSQAEPEQHRDRYLFLDSVQPAGHG